MTISAIGARSAGVLQSLADMRNQLDDLQRQLGTGQKSVTYAGVGLERGLAVGLRTQLSMMGGYDDAINNVGVSLKLAQSSLGRIADIGSGVKQSAAAVPTIDSSGTTTAQVAARAGVDEVLDLLNTQVGDRYLFSGLATDKPAVDTLDHIMNGNGAAAGFKQVLAERKQADLGADGLGRLVISPTPTTATTVSLGETAAGPFGLKLASASSTLSNATFTPVGGAPPTTSVDFTGVPNDGEAVSYSFTLPDGTSTSLTLTATSSATPGTDQFAIGVTPAATAANLQAALTTSLGKLAATSLTAASAVAAGNDFFNTDATHPPQRVAGPPFDTATTLVAGTPANTVSWYIGEDGPTAPRATATAQVDPSIAVSYGMRANEQGIRWQLQNLAVMATVTYSPTDPNAPVLASELAQRVGTNLDVPPGTQKVADIEAELATAQSTMSAAGTRHQQAKATLQDMVQQIEGVSTDDVAAQILALQTRLQASLQTTALLYHTSLVNFLPLA
jgi:flagellin-like hook-associated protein FlgL